MKKRLLLGLGTIVAIVTPVTAVVACGESLPTVSAKTYTYVKVPTPAVFADKTPARYAFDSIGLKTTETTKIAVAKGFLEAIYNETKTQKNLQKALSTMAIVLKAANDVTLKPVWTMNEVDVTAFLKALEGVNLLDGAAIADALTGAKISGTNNNYLEFAVNKAKNGFDVTRH